MAKPISGKTHAARPCRHWQKAPGTHIFPDRIDKPPCFGPMTPPSGQGAWGTLVAQTESDLIEVRLNAIRYGARDTNLYEFVRPDGKPLPPYQPGAHIDVHLPNGIVRQYSLRAAGARAAELHARHQARPGEPRRLTLYA